MFPWKTLEKTTKGKDQIDIILCSIFRDPSSEQRKKQPPIPAIWDSGLFFVLRESTCFRHLFLGFCWDCFSEHLSLRSQPILLRRLLYSYVTHKFLKVNGELNRYARLRNRNCLLSYDGTSKSSRFHFKRLWSLSIETRRFFCFQIHFEMMKLKFWIFWMCLISIRRIPAPCLHLFSRVHLSLHRFPKYSRKTLNYSDQFSPSFR